MAEAAIIPVPLDALGVEAALAAWLCPQALVAGAVAPRATADGFALPLAGGPRAFAAVELLARSGGDVRSAFAPLPRLHAWAARLGPAVERHIAARLLGLSAPRPDWAGLSLARPLIMGILNVTPDSFSDGGAYLTPDKAIAHGHALIAAGADIIDVGGESTRPGATPVPPEDELRRIEPVVAALAATGTPVSVDTRHAAVMTAALAAGARIVNDVSALAGDDASLAVAARAGASVVLMHMQGEPATMQRAPRYGFAPLDVLEALGARIAACEAAGMPKARIVIDPGIGFGKTPAHNLQILGRLALYHALGTGVMIGLSRKSLVGRLAGAGADERLPGSLAGALDAVQKGVQIVRVHDVAETRQALIFASAIEDGG